MLEYTGWDTMAVLNQRQEKIERDRQRAAADKALRDHFAASALTGLLASDQYDRLVTAADYAETAFELADAMLRERSRTGQIGSGGTDAAAKCTDRDSANLDASPEATASVESVAPQPTTRGDSDRTDKAAPRPSEGTGDTPDSPKPIKGGVSDRSKPINGPDPDSRVWETHTPAAHATPGEGSERRECTEPVAWAVACDYGDYGVALFSDEASAQTEADRRALVGLRPGYVVVPLYRHPQPALTDAERDDLRVWSAECVRQASTATEGANEELAERWQGRAKRAAAMIERLGGVECGINSIGEPLVRPATRVRN